MGLSMQERRRHPARAATIEALFGSVLRETRQQQGLTQEKLAFESGYHPTYISMLERGRKSPSLRAIVSLAEVLKVRPSYLLQQFEKRRLESDSGGSSSHRPDQVET